jgi:simple sugar transport system permease protein
MNEALDAAALAGFIAAAVRIATPLLLAALGETVSERSGVINLGLEGAMLVGALAGAYGSVLSGPGFGFVLALVGGAVVGLVLGAVVLGGANQIIAGTAVTLACVGVTGAAHRVWAAGGSAPAVVPTLAPAPVPLLSSIPIAGPALFAHPLPTYAGLLLVPVLWWALFRTRTGLAVRATGESAAMARASGVPVRLVRAAAVLFGGALGGLAGATLVLAQVGSFAERMTAGRGYVAVAIVVLGRWHPLRVGLAAFAFGAATALQFALQALGLDLPYQLFLVLPYVLTLLALAGAVGRTRPPADLGRETGPL